MTRNPRQRALSFGLLGLWCLLLARAAQIQILEHVEWREKAEEIQGGFRPIPANRGRILSADGVLIAESVSNRSLGVDPSLVQDPWPLASALDSLGLVEESSFLLKLQENSARRFLWISRDVLPEARLDALVSRFPSLSLQAESKRLYALGRAGGALVGLVGREDKGLSGLEAGFDRELRGKAGRIFRLSDATGRRFPGIESQVLEEPEEGMGLVLTLDSRMQEIASARMEEGVRREGATAGFAIVTRPATGEILALVTVPSPDPSDPTTWNGESLRLRAITDAFEPGSAYKLVAFAAALEALVLDPEDRIDCMNGTRPVPGGLITDHDPLGVLSAADVLAHSSNIGTGFIAERAGAERFYRMEKSLGFGLPSGIALPGEGRGRIPEPSAWSARSLVTMAFGQEVSCTGIQLAMAYGAVANGGSLMTPLLVREERGPDGTVLRSWEPTVIRQALRPSVTRTLRELLRGVVTKGTGAKAEIEKFPPAGKTSTAQKYIPEEGAYSTRRYTAAFIGFAPWENPELLCLVVLDEPTSSIYGGNVAAPIFREIISDLVPLLGHEDLVAGIPPSLEGSGSGPWGESGRSEPDARRLVPKVAGLSPSMARRLIEEAGFLPRLIGSGAKVVGSAPAPGEVLLPGSVVSLALGEPEGLANPLAMSMPDLRGLSLRDAWLRVLSLEGSPHVIGSGWVLSQRPEPGAPVHSGEPCFLSLGPDSCRAWKEYLQSDERAAWASLAGDRGSASAR